jgi:hypothetical protein
MVKIIKFNSYTIKLIILGMFLLILLSSQGCESRVGFPLASDSNDLTQYFHDSNIFFINLGVITVLAYILINSRSYIFKNAFLNILIGLLGIVNLGVMRILTLFGVEIGDNSIVAGIFLWGNYPLLVLFSKSDYLFNHMFLGQVVTLLYYLLLAVILYWAYIRFYLKKSYNGIYK